MVALRGFQQCQGAQRIGQVQNLRTKICSVELNGFGKKSFRLGEISALSIDIT